ncbi:M28 family metallopeptidase [Mycobacterium sp. CVI_P3]|uniref:M28 family metallopeptidase n=1 Tax=Mycobacterium pinniadriaticum TaxID=2994102 RepID=A0ABT3SNZ9_9MYCO|nr:M28 family metallopeptidase [Mycobacterium pinniadriaticum]MCX2934163.1 M28 family metallopeptidase [Mycobacterium pinniadriaticum]MCX2940585.1 M28 family metallopeptidase [Mycobacterium pinniadriaticum]
MQADTSNLGAVRHRHLAVVVALAVTLGVVGCGLSATSVRPGTAHTAAAEFADGLSKQVTTDAMVGHLQKLQDIADANNGTRAVGTPGFEASVDYVAGMLRDKGFDVQTPGFQTKVFQSGTTELRVGGSGVTAKAMEFSLPTPPQGVSGPLVAAPADDTPGCAPADYDGLPVQGAVVLVDRGSCPFADKQAIAAKLGAVAMVVADNVDEEHMGATLGEDTDVEIPVVGVTKADGARLRANPGPTTLKLEASTETINARNVIAQTKTGSATDVVMVGAHLDSVPEGPGINDNGSGVAAVLETAVRLGPDADVKNAVRFAFWGAEELGTVGSEKYIESLNVDQLKDIALYLNYDMIGSPNPGYFTYDGDQSTAPGRNGRIPRVPEGSAGIERTLVAYLKSAGKTPGDTSFDGRSDYDAFTKAGVPAGGLFSGAEENKTVDQQKLWGGTADAPFDPNYHKSTDTLAHIDRTALGILGRGVAYSVGVYAQDMGGRNGMPVREDRTRHVVNGQ